MPPETKVTNDGKDDLTRLLEKYQEDPKAFAKAYHELETKLTSQGQELGKLRKAHEKLEPVAKTAEQWKPIVEWYNANYPRIQQMFQANGTGANASNGTTQAQAQQVQQSQQVQQAAYQQAQASIPGFDWMTPQEQQRLTQGIAQNITQQVLAPWTQNFAKSVESWADTQKKQMYDNMTRQQQASMDVLWRTFERLVPKEKLDEARAFHTEALKYADPTKINPMDLANETLSERTKRAQLEEELKTLKAEKEARDKAATPSLGSQSSGSLFTKPSGAQPAGTTQDDRFARVMDTVTKEVGADAIRDTFPALR